MSPRPKSEKSKHQRFELRLTKEMAEKLEYCATVLNISKTEVVQRGIDLVKADLEKK